VFFIPSPHFNSVSPLKYFKVSVAISFSWDLGFVALLIPNLVALVANVNKYFGEQKVNL